MRETFHYVYDLGDFADALDFIARRRMKRGSKKPIEILLKSAIDEVWGSKASQIRLMDAGYHEGRCLVRRRKWVSYELWIYKDNCSLAELETMLEVFRKAYRSDSDVVDEVTSVILEDLDLCYLLGIFYETVVEARR